MIQFWWIDTKWACGGVFTKDNIVYNTCPIFYKFKGQNINQLKRSYNVKQIQF